MRQQSLVLSIVALLVGGLPSFARADKKPKAEAAAPPVEVVPQPGECIYRQPGVKECAMIKSGAIDVYVLPGVNVLIRFDTGAPVSEATEADKKVYAVERQGNLVLVRSKRGEDLPDLRVSTVVAGNLTITLNLRPGSSKKFDSQIQVFDPSVDQDEAEFERRCNERLAPKLKEVDQKQRDLDREAKRRAQELLLGAVATGNVVSGEPEGERTRRNDKNIVLRTEKVVRVGAERFLVFSIENRSADPFEVKGVRLWTDSREAPARWRMDRDTVSRTEKVRGAVAVPVPSTGRALRLKLRVDESQPARSIELDGIDVR